MKIGLAVMMVMTAAFTLPLSTLGSVSCLEMALLSLSLETLRL